MDWSEVFHKDGSLRDIYIHDTSLVDWQRFLDFLRGRSGLKASFRWDDKEVATPADVSVIFSERQHAAPLLSLDLQGILLSCHFFTSEEIELDLDPREITTKADADRVFEFIAAIGELLQKDIHLTEENCPESVLHTFESKSD